MTATKATGEYAALSDDRWRVITYGIDSSGLQEGNSELLTRWMDANREILARMIYGADSDAEYQLLCDVDDRVITTLQDAATELVEAVETLRAEARKVAAA